MREDNKLLWTVVVVKQFTEDNVWPCGPTDKASDYESGDCRFESCQGQHFCISLFYSIEEQLTKTKSPTRMGFEPTRAEHIGLAVQRLNHSATVSTGVIGKNDVYKNT